MSELIEICHCGESWVDIVPGAAVIQSTIHFINEPCHFVNPPKKDVNKMQELEYTSVLRRPFKVDAIEITEDNIGALSRYIGDLDQEDDGTIFILVDPRKVQHVPKAYVGFWMTRIGKQTRVYSKRVFDQQFMTITDNVQEWIDFLDEEAKKNA